MLSDQHSLKTSGFVIVTFERLYRGAGNSLPRPGRKQATATEVFDVHISFL
jgi:hypothetical protein